jgi:hypothetical protein
LAEISLSSNYAVPRICGISRHFNQLLLLLLLLLLLHHLNYDTMVHGRWRVVVNGQSLKESYRKSLRN